MFKEKLHFFSVGIEVSQKITQCEQKTEMLAEWKVTRMLQVANTAGPCLEFVEGFMANDWQPRYYYFLDLPT